VKFVPHCTGQEFRNAELSLGKFKVQGSKQKAEVSKQELKENQIAENKEHLVLPFQGES
jgi:hypothetical protein